MLIEASVRPKNMKRGAKTSDLCKALGFKDEVGLSQLCGKLNLSAESPQEFGLLTAMFRVFSPLRNDETEITITINGAKQCTYRNSGEKGNG